MKQKFLIVLLAVSGVLLNITGIVNENFWLRRCGEITFFFLLLFYFLRKLKLTNFNFLMFILLGGAATLSSLARDFWFFEHIRLGFRLGTYIFLVREAIKHTEYEKGNRFTTLYFIGVVALYAWLLFIHVIEIERNVGNGLTLSLYIVYYLNILFLAIAALVYYLNCFSKKSVFFICLTLSFIFSDVLRDMEVFYFRDLSVEVVASLIKFAALTLSFFFFATPEKKLRLLHLV